MDNLSVFCDGACKTSDNTGGWAFIVVDNNNNQVYSEFNSVDNTTNNRMEIISVIKALEYCIEKKIDFIALHTDSMYVIGTMTKNWKRNKNHDLWDILDKLVGEIYIYWHHVKGHAGNKWNNKCDALAVAASNYNKE